MLGQELIRGSLDPALAPNGSCSTRHPPQAMVEAANRQAQSEADVSVGGGSITLRHTRAFMRGWRGRDAQRRACAAGEVRAAVAAALTRAGRTADDGAAEEAAAEEEEDLDRSCAEEGAALEQQQNGDCVPEVNGAGSGGKQPEALVS